MIEGRKRFCCYLRSWSNGGRLRVVWRARPLPPVHTPVQTSRPRGLAPHHRLVHIGRFIRRSRAWKRGWVRPWEWLEKLSSRRIRLAHIIAIPHHHDAHDTRAPAARLVSGPAPSIPVGHRIGVYQVQAALGAGGSASVRGSVRTRELWRDLAVARTRTRC